MTFEHFRLPKSCQQIIRSEAARARLILAVCNENRPSLFVEYTSPLLHHSTTPIVGAGNTQVWPGLNGREADFLKRQAAVRVLGTSAENLR
jgi:hypothetical protein